MKKTYFTATIGVIVLTALVQIPYRHIRTNMPIDGTPASIAKTSVPFPLQTRVRTELHPAVTTTSAPNIKLLIENTLYSAYAAPNTSVLDAMNAVASTSNLVFTGKEYPGMGFFVDSINGKKNRDGYYWILYLNGKSSDTGASQTALKTGDSIEWKYEKSY